MANWETLKEAIGQVIKPNGREEITGQIMQNVLFSIINQVGKNATFAGMATPGTAPGTPDGNVFYLATVPGSYPNFGGAQVKDGELTFLRWSNGQWYKDFAKLQPTLVFDAKPIEGSKNPVYSGGVYKAIAEQKEQVDAARDEALRQINERGQELILIFNTQKVTPEMLSEETKQYINASGGGTITNLPDGEDIMTTGGDAPVLKFANKKYIPENFSGSGRVFLRKNIVNGKNVLTQDMIPIDGKNTIYIIQYDYDLNGSILNIPKNCVLKFDGGSVKNGTMVLNNTIIESEPYKIFENIQFQGKYNIPKAYAEWFGAKGDGVNDDVGAINAALSFAKSIVLLMGKTYKVTSSILMKYRNTLVGQYDAVITADGEFDIIKVGYKCVVSDLSFNLAKPMCVFSIDSQYINETFVAGFVGVDSWIYETSVGINIKNIDIFSPCDDSVNIANGVYCIKSIANGFGKGFWQITVKDVNIIGKYEYGIYINNGIVNGGTVKTWQTDELYNNIKMLYCKNGIYIGKDDEATDIGGFPPERITFNSVSAQYADYCDRFAYVNAGNRIVFDNCEAWDWGKRKPFLINPNMTMGVFINKCTDLSTSKNFDLTTLVLKEAASIPSATGIGNSPLKGTYDIGFFFDEERLKSGQKLTIGEVKSLPSGNYLIGMDTRWNKLFGLDRNYIFGYGASIMSLEQLRNNGVLIILYPMYSVNTPQRSRFNGILYQIIPQTSTESNTNPIFDFIALQPQLRVSENVADFLDVTFYKYNYSGWVKTNSIYPKLAFKYGDNIALDALGYTLTDSYGDTRPTGLSYRDKGKTFFDTILGKNVFWDGAKWIDSNGISVSIITKGTTGQRPILDSSYAGFEYYDTTLKKKILWNGAKWVNVDGTTL